MDITSYKPFKLCGWTIMPPEGRKSIVDDLFHEIRAYFNYS